MSSKDQTLKEKILEWIQYSLDDLHAAELIFAARDVNTYRIVAFHCQQSVEKAFKAYLISQSIDFPYTHDLGQLLHVFPEQEFAQKLKFAIELTPYAVLARYPGENEPVSLEESNHSIQIAQNVLDEIKTKLREEKML